MSTTRRHRSVFAAIALLSVLGVSACASGTPAAETSAAGETAAATTVVVEDNHGPIEVPVNPKSVVALDNTTFQVLSDWGIEVTAAPKRIMGDSWPNLTGEQVLDVGLHTEPNLEAVIQAQPDLIIGGYRFSGVYDDLKAIQPATIEISAREGQDKVSELKRQVTILGQIFDREEEAQKLSDELDASVTAAKTAYNGTDTVVGLITSGGKISYAAPGTGRSIGAVFRALDLAPGIEQAAGDTSHGDDISVEAIAAANPEWLIVMDRDAKLGQDGYVSAQELIEGAEALKNVPAVQKGQIIYLAPGFYLDEGIQGYTQLFNDTAAAFSAAS